MCCSRQRQWQTHSFREVVVEVHINDKVVLAAFALIVESNVLRRCNKVLYEEATSRTVGGPVSQPALHRPSVYLSHMTDIASAVFITMPASGNS